METISTTSSVTPRTKGGSFDMPSRPTGTRQMKEGRDDYQRRQYSDDQVHVNLAMADLMAYLQVVANNSTNLPMTRRDDSELKRMVSNLSGEEFARKSAAFIPADVRVIGGSFTKYGRVWDLPTSEEYNAQDGAQEPGRSYGGACSNAMLKVLYDAANEAMDSTENTGASNDLFDDEEDEATLTGMSFNHNHSFASLDVNNNPSQSTLTWATLMSKMKAEIKDVEYPQVPTLTSTRKLDLNQKFSLVPECFDPTTSKRRSLLIGCNYTHINGAQLKASHDDVRSMKDYIVNVHGFPESDEMMTVLLDDDDHKHPTFFNITEAFKSLSEKSQPGDAVFIHFAGHGGRVLDPAEDTDGFSYDEVVVPSDYTTNGLIRDTLIFKTLLAPMRYGVTVTILIDACDTGMVLDLPYAWSTRGDRGNSVPKMVQNENFSFVRFLKVVKTLYESSTFTQLGRTVGSALTSGNLPRNVLEEEESQSGKSDAPKEVELSPTVEQQVAAIEAKAEVSGGGFFSFLCGAPDVEEVRPTNGQESKQKRKTQAIAANSPSLFEQVVTCTLGQDVGGDILDDASIESYLKANETASYSDREGGETTDDSFDEEDLHSRHGRRRRAKPH